jgi:hypothetical protein
VIASAIDEPDINAQAAPSRTMSQASSRSLTPDASAEPAAADSEPRAATPGSKPATPANADDEPAPAADEDGGNDQSPRTDAGSTGGSTHRTNRGGHKVRTLDNMDEKQTAGALINSPRSIIACAKEGIDVKADLYYKKLQAFVLPAKGDREVATIKWKHYLARRADLLAAARARREELITMTEERAPKRVATPTVRSTTDLTGTTPSKRQSTAANDASPPASPAAQSASAIQLSDDGSDFYSTDSEEIERREKEELERKKHEKISPEEFQRRQRVAKNLKVARQVARMQRAVEKNQKREEQQKEHTLQMRRRMMQQDRDREAAEEREELQRFLRDRAARKRDAELAALRAVKEGAMRDKQAQLMQERAEAQAVRALKDEARLAAREERQFQREAAGERKREENVARQGGIAQHNEELVEGRKEMLLGRMAHADEQRDALERQRDLELQQRKEDNAARAAENRTKRRNADRDFTAKLGGYVQKARDAEASRKEFDDERKNFLTVKRAKEQQLADHRHEHRVEHAGELQRKNRRLAKKLRKDDLHCQEVAAEKRQHHKLRAAELDVVADDRAAHVRRMHLQQEHASEEARLVFDQKVRRIETLQTDARDADENRRKLQADAFRLRPAPLVRPTPGPGEYRVVDVSLDTLHGMKMGNPSHKKAGDGGAPPRDTMPGPGQYGAAAPAAIRANRGYRMPPRHGGMPSHRSGGTTVRSATSLAGSPRSTSSQLPSIRRANTTGSRRGDDGQPARANTSMALRPAELRDDDFDTDDEFEDI